MEPVTRPGKNAAVAPAEGPYHAARPSSVPCLPAGEPGFTLMEILVALFLFAMVVSILAGAFDRIFADMDALGIQHRFDETAAACFDVMRADCQGVYLPLPGENARDDDGIVTHGENRSGDFLMRFSSFHHIVMGAAPSVGLARITYYLSPETAPLKGFRLMRQDRRYPQTSFAPTAADLVLCRQLTAIDIVIMDTEGNAHETWAYDNSDETETAPVPSHVTIELELHRSGRTARYRTQIPLGTRGLWS
jgi:prepilin-type N-terminal cleavage/methylation domain-containing protein